MNTVAKFFNIAGPVNPNNHYLIEPLHRIDLEEIQLLIDRQMYFILHAPRQTGKTSYMLALMEYLNQQGKYKCLYVNVEAAQAAKQNVKSSRFISLLYQSPLFFPFRSRNAINIHW